MFKKVLSIFILIFFSTVIYSQDFPVRKNSLKTTFLSFYTGSTKLTYERSLSSNQSIEITGGVIGVGFDGQHNKPSGGLVRYAHKFIFPHNIHYPLNGMYVKPEFALSSFNYDAIGEDYYRKNSTMGTLMACFGYQWGKKVLAFDSFIGIGGALGSECDTYYQHGFILWDFFNKHCKYISLTFGMKLGINFGKKSA